jgi:hypothetical protein
MDWPLFYGLVSDAAKTPLVAAGIGGVIGATLGSIYTHHFTQKREREKLLREKAEELITIFYQIRHKLFVWHDEIMRLAASSEPREGETLAESTARKSSIPRKDHELVTSLLFDLCRAETLQRLYFPPMKSYFQAHFDAVFLLIKWLRNQGELQEADFPHWVVRFYEEDAERWIQLYEAHETACNKAMEAVVRTVPRSRTLARALARPKRPFG